MPCLLVADAPIISSPRSMQTMQHTGLGYEIVEVDVRENLPSNVPAEQRSFCGRQEDL